MKGKLYDGPYTMVDDPESVDVVIANTRSFIQPATEKSIDTISKMGQHKEHAPQQGKKQKIIVTGCMVQRFCSALEEELPEVDFSLDAGQYHRIDNVIEDVFKRSLDSQVRSYADTPMYIHDEMATRLPSWKKHFMSAQSAISNKQLECHIGKKMLVLVDRPSEDHEWVKVGRLETQAPDVAGVVFLDVPIIICDRINNL